MAGQETDPLPGKDATLRGRRGDPGTGGFPVEAIGRRLQEAKGLGIWAGLGCGHGAQVSWKFPFCCSSLLTVLRLSGSGLPAGGS